MRDDRAGRNAKRPSSNDEAVNLDGTGLKKTEQISLTAEGTIVGSSDTSRARKAYQDFFALWRDADPDLRILIDSKKEYERLNKGIYGLKFLAFRHKE